MKAQHPFPFQQGRIRTLINTGNFRDGTPVTFWVTPGVHVPIQYQYPDKYLDGEGPFQSYELKGWG
jgi:hypothetical protein